MSPTSHPIYRFRDFEVDPLARTLRRGDATVSLSRRSFDLLVYFVQNSGRVLSKDELLKNIWPDTFVDENSLAKSISLLRKALEENPLESTLVLTIPGRGYQFAASVETAGPLVAIDSEALSATRGRDGNGGIGAIGVVVRQRTITTKIDEGRDWPGKPLAGQMVGVWCGRIDGSAGRWHRLFGLAAFSARASLRCGCVGRV